VDRVLPATLLARAFAQAGHQKVGVVSADGDLLELLGQALRHIAPAMKLEPAAMSQSGQLFRNGVTAFICEDFETGAMVINNLKRENADVPGKVSVAAVGVDHGEVEEGGCSGFAVTHQRIVEAVRELICDVQLHKPRPIWLLGDFIDRNTMPVPGGMLLS